MNVSFMPQSGKFFELFAESAKNSVEVAQKLKDLMYHWENVEDKVAAIADLEHKGDNLTHQIAAELHRTFVTPFDREDIALLAHTLDDVTDFIHSAADAMLLYKAEPNMRARELSDVIVEIVVAVEIAMKELTKKIDQRKMLKACVEINRLENVADRIYRAALAELFSNSTSTDVFYVMKWREIYEHMETVTDRCEDVANVLEGVAIKYS